MSQVEIGSRGSRSKNVRRNRIRMMERKHMTHIIGQQQNRLPLRSNAVCVFATTFRGPGCQLNLRTDPTVRRTLNVFFAIFLLTHYAAHVEHNECGGFFQQTKSLAQNHFKIDLHYVSSRISDHTLNFKTRTPFPNLPPTILFRDLF
jgi:uncharacterized membrane protein